MSKAKMAVFFVQALSEKKFPDDAPGMEKYVISWLLSFADIKSQGSHKYIPTERLNEQLGLRQDGGVFGYVKFQDDSYILLTCEGPLAIWDGLETVPEFPKFS